MSQGAVDPRWPKLLSLTVHEFRTPMTVVAGYIRMLLKERAGPVSEQQRRLLEEAEKSCGRLSALITELSELSGLVGETAVFNRKKLDLRVLLSETIEALPEMPDRDVRVELSTGSGPAPLHGDEVRLRAALGSVLVALRRELVTSDCLHVRERVRPNGGIASWIVVAADTQIDSLDDADPAALDVFDEWRGGCGLSLAIARRVIHAHGGYIWSPAQNSKAAAVMTLPHAV